MSPAEDYFSGAATAAMLIHQTTLTALLAEGVLKREPFLALLDEALLSAEGMQTNAAALKDEARISVARGARIHLVALHKMLRALDLQSGKGRKEGAGRRWICNVRRVLRRGVGRWIG